MEQLQIMSGTPIQLKTKLPNTVSLMMLIIVLLYAFIINFVLSFSSSSFVNINAEVADGTFTNKLFWICTFMYAIYAWQSRVVYKTYNLNLHVYLLLMYVLLAVGSAFWSDVPLISLRRSLQQSIIIFCVLTPALLGVSRDLILESIFKSMAAFILINMALIPVLGVPDFGYRGICPQKNILGQISTVAFFFSIYAAMIKCGKPRFYYLSLAAMAVGLCLISHSKTSLALLIVVPLVSLLFVTIATIKDPLKKISYLFFIVVLAYLVYAASVLVPFDLYDISNLMYHDRTFTGRTEIWDFSGYYINQSPIVGYGYGSFWGVGASTKAIGQGFIGGLLQAHNGYVDIVLELGYIGLTLAVLFIFALMRNIVLTSKTNQWLGMLLFSCLLFVLLNNTMESSLFRSYVPLWITLLLCVGLSAPNYENNT